MLDTLYLAGWLIIANLLAQVNSYTNSTLPIPNYFPPGVQCSSYCLYEINSAFNYVSQCTSDYTFGNGNCLKCDPLLFRPVAGSTPGTTFNCIPHLYNSETQEYFNNVNVYKFGYYNPANVKSYVNTMSPIVISLKYHFAVRLRFSVYLYEWDFPTYIYPLAYSMDLTSYLYNQTLDKYWSNYDIITSPLQNHSDNTVTVSFRLLDRGYPYNTDTSCSYHAVDGICNCDSFWGCGAVSTACCEQRYIQVTDVLLFSSLCQTGCLNCTSATYCKICDQVNGYYLYPADHLCYTTCPQATYKDNVTLFLASTTYNILEYICTTCNATCLECSNLTICTICYPYGRNESFLYMNSCINPCINGYSGNYSNHICYCHPDYHYENFTNLTASMCLSCAVECVRCTGPTNLECSSCEKGYYLAYQTTHCLVQCPIGQYKSDLTRTCLPCDSSCSSCELKSTLCTECFFASPIKYLLGQECLTWCPPGYSWNNVTYRCDICNIYTYSLWGKCLPSCPTMYRAENSNRSCIHLSRTDYHLGLKLIDISILNHGKLMRFQLLAQDGLNLTSYDTVIKKSYYSVQIAYTDTSQQALSGVARNLATFNLPIINVKYQNNHISYYTQLPPNLDYHKAFQVAFLEPIAGAQNLSYSNLTDLYRIAQHPELLKNYYTYVLRNLNNIIVIPFIVTLCFLFALQLKGLYALYLEAFRIVQLLGLLLYSSFPVGPQVFYFLLGCSYANLDFLPNIYALVNPESANNLSSFLLAAPDMDFIRLNGSVLLFAVVWSVVVVVAKFGVGVKEKRVDYLVGLGLDLMEVKVLHSFWSAVIFVLLNYNSSNFSIFATFCFAGLVFGGVLLRRYWEWRERKEVDPLFVWRLGATLLVCFLSLANELLLTLLFGAAVAVTGWQFYLLHSSTYLVPINSLNSRNYMQERTFRILNAYDQEIPYCWAISLRNTLLTILPALSVLLAASLVLLKDSQSEVVIVTIVLIYFLLLLVIANSVFLFLFLEERREYLVQNKLEYLQKKYAKLGTHETIVYEERRRPRVNSYPLDEEKYLEQHPARSMMKNID